MSKIYNFEKFEVIKNLIRISSWFLISILLFAIIFTLLSNGFESYSINYFIVFLSVFTLFFNAIILFVISILYKLREEKVFYNIKKELILFLASLASLMLLSSIIQLKY
ncbi:hypothetical protein [Flavobacterium lipolyticum]|uniref:Uncharacterized protein n=1 Tax=Flavobacterium lipolyticum TaxID=2893754 RepID=A0ABS8M3U3_9FLAO|nr:hypothetical protein [Flavobacterium sp. F-126]MCC9019432.1 hypothetical protein [Flavobacterium sp. F-126]